MNRKWLFKLFYSIVMIGIIGSLVPVLATDKSYTISNVSIDCTVLKDTNVIWKEDRTFAFKGEYSFGYYDLPIKGYDWVKEIVVRENNRDYLLSEDKAPGSFWVEHLADKHRIHYYFLAKDETRTFSYWYRIEGAIQVYQDYGQWYWKLQGTGWDKISDFRATIHLEKPQPIDDYKVWVHGPSNGKVTKVDDKTILIEAKDVPKETFIELRLLVPSTYFTSTDRLPGSIGPLAMKEEKQLGSKMIATKNHQKRSIFWNWFWILFMSSLTIFLVLLLFYWYAKFGREYKVRTDFDYIREPPSDLPPSELGYLMSFDTMNPKSLQAILLDLTHRGYIGFKKSSGEKHQKDVMVLVKKEGKTGTFLNSYEKILYEEILFKDSTEISPRELKNKKEPMDRLKQELEKAVAGRDFFDPKSMEIASDAIAIGAIMLVVFVLLGWLIPRSSVFLVLIPFYFLFGTKAITRRSKAGKLEFEKWRALKRFLEDFSKMQEYPPESVVVWEKYLIYGTILGVSKKVIYQLKLRIDEIKDLSNSAMLLDASMDLLYSVGQLSLISSQITSTLFDVSSDSLSKGSSLAGAIIGIGGSFLTGGGAGGGGSGGGMG